MNKRLLLWLFLLFSGSALADTVWTFETAFPAVTGGASKDAACTAYAAYHYPGSQVFVPSINGGPCGMIPVSGPSKGQPVQVYVVQTYEGTVPTPPPDCSARAGTTQTVRTTTAAGSASLPTQDANGCAINPGSIEVKGCYKSGDGAHSYCDYVVQRTGAIAPVNTTAPAATLPPSTPQAPGDTKTGVPGVAPAIGANGTCPAGSVEGGIDSGGIPICVGTGTSGTAAPIKKVSAPTTVVNADGSSTATTTTSVTNVDGTTTTINNYTTTGADGSVTTSQTKSTSALPSGFTGKDNSADPTGFCAQNPQLTICQNSSVSGSCDVTSCTGDAIQCATLREAAIMECREKSDADALSKLPVTALGNSILSGADPLQSAGSAAIAGTTVDLSNPNLDTSGFIGGGSCLAPKTMTVAGRSFTVDFTSVCATIQPIRYAVLACASVLAYLIVAKSVLG